MSSLAIQDYYNELQKLKDFGGSKKETAIRDAFKGLLNEYASQKGLILVSELTIKSLQGNNITPDGTLKDSLRLDWGYWESKDEYDDINVEIQKKFVKGYPKDNILFEDSKTAILFQNGSEVARISMNDPSALDNIIKSFINYERPEVVNFHKAIELFKNDIPNVVIALRHLINDTANSNQRFISLRKNFLETCRQSINPNITQDDVNEMMIQHILTADIFNTIFDEPYFHRENNIAKQLETVINTFFNKQIRNDLLAQINLYYQAINATAAGIADHHEKQKFLKIVYENFYKSYNPKAADRLGVVYTPNEIVRFMIESTDYLLHRHFGRMLADKNVEILDPASGTGTFICDMIDYLPKDKLEYKYRNEIHANEVAILPYYIANLNIEFTYKQRMGEYAEFENLCFVDTLDNMGFDYKNKQDNLFSLSAENTERILRQNERKISVIIGNPPYNANQMNENDNNKNREYPMIDKRIKDTYIKNSTAQKTKLYDMYSRFYRWAMDRLGEEGIIAFVTNRSFINSRTYDGFRKVAASEFDHIYIVDLGGDVRANPKLSGPKHNVFAIQTGVAIMFLVKTKENKIVVTDENEFNYLKKTLKLKKAVSEPEVYYGVDRYISPVGCRIFYIRRPEMETASEKFEFLSFSKIEKLIRDGSFEHIIPDKDNNWIELVENDWEEMIPLANKGTKLTKNISDENAIFKLYSLGVVTNRDEWVYDLNKINLGKKVKYLIDIYNREVYRLNNIEKSKIKDNVDYQIKWTRAVKNDLFKGKKYFYQGDLITGAIYRPFTKEYLYFSNELNEMQYQMPIIFQNKTEDELENIIISLNGSNGIHWNCIASKYLIDLNALYGGSQSLPLYRYIENGEQIDNITDWGLNIFRERYGNYNNITKEDIFNYVYAVLHNPAYRKKYEMNLKREFPRIPLYNDFWKWAEWGKKLMDLHINFETIESFPLEIKNYELKNEINRTKLKANKETGEIILDDVTALEGIPKEAWEYKLGTRSALEWILDQYKEKKPKDKTIAEKFNTYKFADYKDQVINLLMRVTTVSVETMRIIKEMEIY